MKVLAVVGLSFLALAFLIAPYYFVLAVGGGCGAGRGTGMPGQQLLSAPGI